MGFLLIPRPFICKAAIIMFEELGIKVHAEDFIPFVGMGENRYIGGVAEKYKIKLILKRLKQELTKFMKTL